MNAYDFIKSRQIEWAKNKGIRLIGSGGSRGLPSYATDLNQNLFMPLLPEVLSSFEAGDGGEVAGNQQFPAKMQALHSSSALGVNIFQYWLGIHDIPGIAVACGFCVKGSRAS